MPVPRATEPMETKKLKVSFSGLEEGWFGENTPLDYRFITNGYFTEWLDRCLLLQDRKVNIGLLEEQAQGESTNTSTSNQDLGEVWLRLDPQVLWGVVVIVKGFSVHVHFLKVFKGIGGRAGSDE